MGLRQTAVLLVVPLRWPHRQVLQRYRSEPLLGCRSGAWSLRGRSCLIKAIEDVYSLLTCDGRSLPLSCSYCSIFSAPRCSAHVLVRTGKCTSLSAGHMWTGQLKSSLLRCLAWQRFWSLVHLNKTNRVVYQKLQYPLLLSGVSGYLCLCLG